MSKISYLVSTYDSGEFLDAHLQDLLVKQTDRDFEVVIVNPDSPGTDHIVASRWAERDPRVKYIYYEKREPYGRSWLRAWREAEGEYVSNSNTDDFHHPRFTDLCFNDFKRAQLRGELTGPHIAFAYAGLIVLDENHKVIGGGTKPPFNFEVYSRECWGGPQLLWRNDHEFKELLDWDLMWQRAGEHKSAFDYWLALYFMSLGFHGHSIGAPLTYYTQRAGSIENSNKWANNYETFSSIAEFFPHQIAVNLKHAREFADFENLPPKDEWIACKQAGKKWK